MAAHPEVIKSSSTAANVASRKIRRKRFMIFIIPAAVILLLFLLNQYLNLDDRFRLGKHQKQGAEMAEHWRGILWPSLGNPAELGPGPKQQELTVIFCSPQPMRFAPAQIAAQLLPVTAETGPTPVSLQMTSHAQIELTEIPGRGSFSDWTIRYSPWVYRLNFTVPPMAAVGSRRTLLFDLLLAIQGVEYKKYGAVFLTFSPDDLRLAVTPDVHVCSRWDDLEDGFKRFFPEVAAAAGVSTSEETSPESKWTSSRILKDYINPNRNFVDLVKQVNDLHRRGELDALVLLGDMVDYKFKRERSLCGGSYQESEWSLLETMLLGHYPGSERLEVPLFTTTGNHDYRLYPYKLQIYGLQHTGVPKEVTMDYLRRSGQWVPMTYRLCDLDAVRINSGRNHSLNYYYRLFNPMDDFRLGRRGAILAFLDTGSDAMCHHEYAFSRRIGRYVGNIEHPASAGFTLRQAEFLKRALEDTNKTVVLFCHAPILVTPGDGVKGSESDSHLPLRIRSIGEPITLDADLKFEQQRAVARLDSGAVFCRPLRIIQSVRGSAAQRFVVSGHNHCYGVISMDKSGQLMNVPLSSLGQMTNLLTNNLVFMQLPSLAHIPRNQSLDSACLQWLRLRIAHGRIETVELSPLVRPRN